MRWAWVTVACCGCNALLGIDGDQVEILCEVGSDCPSGFCGAELTCDERQWARVFGDSAEDEALDVAHFDSDGPGAEPGWTVVVGAFAGAIEFGEGLALESADGLDAFVVALDERGETRWAQQLSGQGDQRATAVAVDADGRVYVIGSTTGDAVFGPDQLDFTAGTAAGFMARIESDGQPTWARQFAVTMALSVDDVVVIEGAPTGVGSYRGAWTTPLAAVAPDSLGLRFGYTIAFDAEAQLGISSAISATLDVEACCAHVDPLSGSLIIGGTFSGEIPVAAPLVAVDERDSFLFALARAPDGGIISEGVRFDAQMSVLSTDSLGRVSAGWAGVDALVEPGFAVSRLAASASELVRGTAPDGTVQIAALAHSSANDTIAFGSFRAPLDIVEGPSFSPDDEDLFLLFVDESFALPPDRSRAFGGRGAASAGGIAVDAEDRAIIVGSFDGRLELGNDFGTPALEAAGATDAFVAQMEL